MSTNKPVSYGSPFWKGKGKAGDESDLNPTITYKSLLSKTLGSKDPLRVIALCDSDAFYAACEMIRLGVPDKPLVVLQWQSLIAVNYPARKFGITRMMKIQEAQERCPDLIVVHVATYKEGDQEPQYRDSPDSRTHKVSLDLYRRESVKMLQMYKNGLPGSAEVEKASIDEAFIDLTQPVREIMIERYPYLTHVPNDAPLGADTPLPQPPQTSWHESTIISPNDEASVEMPTTWHDIALSIGAECMQRVREQILNTLGYTTSAGIARNKFLAKLCASHRKPMGQSVLRNAAIPAYLQPLEFRRIRFLGGKLGDALADVYDVSTVADLLQIYKSRRNADEIWRGVYLDIQWGLTIQKANCQSPYAAGSCSRSDIVKEKQALMKSMLASKNLPHPVTQLADGYPWIRVLAAELALRLIEARTTAPNMWPKTLVMGARNSRSPDGRNRSKQAPWPFIRDITVDAIAAVADRLWKELIDPTVPFEIIGVSLAFSGIEAVEAGLKSIDGFFKGHSLKRPFEGEPLECDNVPDVESKSSRNISKDSSTFVCGRCGHRTVLTPSATRTETERQAALDLIQMEHDDFHLALNLSKLSGEQSSARSEPPKKKQKKKKDLPQGIARFFQSQSKSL
ncbi:unnamed protein product [Mycena citricolor]|uniref:DNA polymerase eta n=1 Tax=Mycena citricolor TaxID=2018698 RepID=A0AAD2Q2F2_9AGAR|nr:unnamed protein product [Mycena citricolor]